MTRLDIRLIAAVGKSGQIGLNGKLPWNDREDMDFFKSQIHGGIVIVGRKTYDSMPLLFGCSVKKLRRTGPVRTDKNGEKSFSYKQNPEDIIRMLENKYEDWPQPPVIWIAGGRSVYIDWAPYIKRMVISNIDYDGPCDVKFPWEAFGKVMKNGND